MSSIEQNAVVDFYDTPFLAEHWDLVSKSSSGYDSDVIVYWKELLKVRELNASHENPSESFVVVDVGTGTGRVLKGLDRCAEQHGMLFPDMEFIGIDISQHMLDRAAESARITKVGRVSWRCGSALELPKLLESSRKSFKVDFLFSAVHSIGHLVNPGELEHFFLDVANLLQHRTGRACISVWKAYLLTTDDEEAKTHYDDIDGPPMINVSKQFPGVFYRSQYRGEEVVNDAIVSKTDVQVIRKHEDGREEVIESNPTVLKVKIFREPTLMRIIEASGLEVLSRDATAMDVIFTLGLK